MECPLLRRAAPVPAAVLFAFVLALLCALAPTVDAAPSDAPADAPASFDAASAYVYAPKSALESSRPVQVVFALHGMGGEGQGFCQGLLGAADRNGWVVVAPTFSYRNWKDPATVAADDVALTRGLVDLLDALPDRIGRPVDSKAVVFGFSRGAQLAHRFAETYPDRTRAAVVMSAGSYTVPSPIDERGAPLSFPFGTADLAARSGHPVDPKALVSVPFWVAVGGSDTNPGDVPRQWDGLFGTTRVERAGSFVRLLKAVGTTATLNVFPNTGHEMTPDMVRAAVEFLRQATAPAPTTLGIRPGAMRALSTPFAI
jgi:pimeloyl-ACP methyl ester carboxylesterase